MPIQTRTEMLATGVRCPRGIEVFGDDLGTIEKTAIDIEHAVAKVSGNHSAFTERSIGGFYIDSKSNARRRRGMDSPSPTRLAAVAPDGHQVVRDAGPVGRAGDSTFTAVALSVHTEGVLEARPLLGEVVGSAHVRAIRVSGDRAWGAPRGTRGLRRSGSRFCARWASFRSSSAVWPPYGNHGYRGSACPERRRPPFARRLGRRLSTPGRARDRRLREDLRRWREPVASSRTHFCNFS